MSRDRQSRSFQIFDLLTNLTADGVIRGLAAAGATFAARRVIVVLWTKVMGKEPPAHPEDPQVSLSEALGWGTLAAVTMQTARILAIRAAESRLRSPDRESTDAADG
jgi:Protein of unknown function (DUF4235)